jgi:phage gp36-like protein
MFLTADELYTHLFPETITAISGTDERLLLAAISGAISETKGYLSAFDIAAIFAKTGDDRDALLLIWCKDIAVWHYIAIARPAIDYEVRETRYKAAIAWLKGVQKGDIVPPDFPRPTDPETSEELNTSGIKIGSLPKRGNYI